MDNKIFPVGCSINQTFNENENFSRVVLTLEFLVPHGFRQDGFDGNAVLGSVAKMIGGSNPELSNQSSSPSCGLPLV